MAKASEKKRTDVVKTGVFVKEVRVPIDPEDIEKKEIAATKVQLKIRKIQHEIQPQLLKITGLRAEHRKLIEDIEKGSELQKAKVYEIKNFKRATADIYLAETDQKVDERTLEKADYNADVEEQAEDESADA
jgi:signal transduction histidine kinase